MTRASETSPSARRRGLRLISRTNRLFATGAVVLTAAFSVAAAKEFHSNGSSSGSTSSTTSATSSDTSSADTSSSTSSSDTSSSTSSLQQPTQTPSSTSSSSSGAVVSGGS